MSRAKSRAGVSTPVVELTATSSGPGRRAAATAIDHALHGVGFMAVTGHGVDAALVARMFAAVGSFLALPLDEKLRAPLIDRPAPFRDALIGATALLHGLIMVTRNVRDFARFDDLDIVNPWA